MLTREYDADDRLIREQHTDQSGIRNEYRYGYDAADNMVLITDASGNRTEYTFDLCDRETGSLSPDGGRTRTDYDRNGNVVRRYTPLQLAALEEGNGTESCWRYEYDLCNRPEKIISPDGTIRNRSVYDAAGSLVRDTDAAGNGVTITYNLAGFRKQVTTSGGITQRYEYDALGNNTALTDTEGNRTEFLPDAWGRITEIRKADGSTEQYAYDHAGNLLRSVDGAGNAVNYRYDVRGNMTMRTDQEGHREFFTYDREDRLLRQKDRNGNRTDFTYNMYGSLLTRTAVSPDGANPVTENFGYYADGSLRYAISNGMRYDYTYDCMGRLARKSASGRTLLENCYDLNGNRISMSDITGKKTDSSRSRQTAESLPVTAMKPVVPSAAWRQVMESSQNMPTTKTGTSQPRRPL